MRILLDAGEPEGAGVFLQQSVEKLLKGFLLAKGWELKRTHDLEALIDAAVVYDPTLAPFRPVCQEISNYYFIDRYPAADYAGGPSQSDLERSLQTVGALLDRLREAIP